MIENRVSIVNSNAMNYDNVDLIDDAVRRELDSLCIPKGYIKEGMNILIKPNLVMDKNGLAEEGTDCLYTQPSVVKPVIDFILEETNGNVRIVIGDAPMQECVFEQIKGYQELVDEYKSKGVDVELVDFRELKSEVKNNVHIATINNKAKGRVINLGDRSAFYGIVDDQLKKLRVTNYDPTIMTKHHHGEVHEYYISQYVLDADLIVNMPKPKTHRKAGVTISLKNFVGANTRKEFLPHHTLGSVEEGGDEYLDTNFFHKLRSCLLDKKNKCAFDRKYTLARIYDSFITICSALMKFGRNEYAEGSWYGNDTISKTIVDLNNLIVYADKKGEMKDSPQRQLLIVGDMIIAGEKEGPVYPTAKKVGMIVAGYNPVYFDTVIARLMGFDVNKIPSIFRSWNSEGLVTPGICDKDIAVVGDYNIHTLPNLHFVATSGWKDHIEL